MILENQFRTVFSLEALNEVSTELLPASDSWDSSWPAVTWHYKEGQLPEPDEWGMATVAFYQVDSGKGVVRDAAGRPVRKVVQVPHVILEKANPNPINAHTQGVVKAGPPCPQRKLSADEDILSDGPTGRYMVVVLSSRIETPEQQLQGRMDEISQLVRENNVMLKSLVD